jgi:hypothetical protein
MGVDISGRNSVSEDGDYFGLNWWSWRPIHMVCEHLNEQHKLKMNMESWGDNSGAGLRTQKQCDRLAKVLDEFINSPSSPMVEDSDMIYICFGSWIDSKNHFINKETIDKHGLNDQYEYCEIIHGGVVTNDGEIYYPSHGCNKLTIKRFISFLKECGGFKIY